jgi:asparagine synthase (glutamine-hydrolysing)
MSTSDGRYTLVYNGEVYNFAEIRRDLESLGESFASTGDTEVVFKACVRWGEEAVMRFRGMFALGFWDETERRLLLARDRLGIKPLYLVRDASGIAFASEVRTLLAAGASRRVLSPKGLLGYLRYGSVQEPDTILADVQSLPPGSFLIHDDRGSRERAYWVLPADAPIARDRDDLVTSLRCLLHESVRLQLVADVPFGIFLSGGADSAALTAIASAESSQPVHTFTVVFDEKSLSEEVWAADVAGRFGCVHHSVHVTGADAATDLVEAFRDQDQPSGDGLNSWLVSRAARREGLSMALSGLGGDEVFAGYPNFRHFGFLVRASRVGGVCPSGVSSYLEARAARPGASHRLRKAIALAQAEGKASGVYQALRCLFTDGQIERLLPGPAFRRVMGSDVASECQAMSGDSVNDFSRFELTGYMRNTLLRDTDTMSMANSLEVRVPLLDERLVDFMLKVPGDMKLDRSVNKPLLFDAVPALPRDIGRRPKMGFVLPLADWFRGPMKDGLEEIILGLRGPAAGVIRRSASASAWTAFLAGKQVSASRLWATASLAAWMDEHDVILPW